MTQEELDAEYESITHENFWNRWVEKVNSLDKNKRTELIEKVQKKYRSDEYKDKEWKKGCEPREELYTLLCHYACRYGEDILQKRVSAGDILYFCCGLYLVDDSYVVEYNNGQGGAIDVYTIAEYKEYQRRMKLMDAIKKADEQICKR